MKADVIKDTIATSAGKLINPFTATADGEEFDIHVIANALSMQCRYAGHTSRHYSVAEHSLLVEQVVTRRALVEGHHGGLTWLRRWALIHDAEEAYLPDMPAPFKKKDEMTWYREAGKRLMAEIASWCGLEGVEPEIVKQVDVELRGTERYWLFPPCPEWETAPVIAGIVCGTMTPEGAREAWLARFHELWPEWPAPKRNRAESRLSRQTNA